MLKKWKFYGREIKRRSFERIHDNKHIRKKGKIVIELIAQLAKFQHHTDGTTILVMLTKFRLHHQFF